MAADVSDQGFSSRIIFYPCPRAFPILYLQRLPYIFRFGSCPITGSEQILSFELLVVTFAALRFGDRSTESK